ncbi:MAG TPA: Gfo/Idh/MocA family oxidoreductase [Acidimicrobiia bacterium]
MKNTSVGIGIIGTGFGTVVAAPAFAAATGASVNGIYSRNLTRARAEAARLGVPFATDQMSELCERADVDLVFVATPPHLHRDAVLTALDAGKHVACEKPFGLGPAEALEMLERATEARRLHFLDFEFRTDPARRALAALIERGDLGDVHQVVVTAMVAGARFPVMNREGWWLRSEDGGGWLGAMGSHYVDALRAWFGEIRSVAAHLEVRREHLSSAGATTPITADDGFCARLTTESGIVCTINSVSTIGAEIGPRIEMYGTSRTAVLENDRFLRIVDDAGNATTRHFAADVVHSHPSRGPLEAWAEQIVEAVAAGRQLTPSFLDGLRCQEVMAAARRSHRRGGVVTPVEQHPHESATPTNRAAVS